LNESRRTPATRCSTGDYAFAFFGPKDESAFDHVRYDGHALCVPHDVVGNTLIGCVHDLVQHFGCVIEPVDRLDRC
jgi:hypothetical protein